MTEATPGTRNAEKLIVMEALLKTRNSVFIHLNPAISDGRLSLPQHLRKQAQIVLQVGFNMPIPIPDLRADETGVYGTLSFKGVPFTCQVPWEAIFALVGDDAKGKVWSEDMPEQIASAMDVEKRRKDIKIVDGGNDPETRPTDPYLKPVKRERPEWMKVVKGGKA
jgi:hypothetical protein